jgi:Methyltransferase domain/Domain of unknown function (DUF4214)
LIERESWICAADNLLFSEGPSVKEYLRKLVRAAPKPAEGLSEARVDVHRDFVVFLYSVLFGRRPESGAVEQWSGLLSQGLSYEGLFESLWRSEEFKDKAPHSLFFKMPPRMVDESHGGALITDQYLSEIIELVKADPLRLLQIPTVRSWLAARRYRDLTVDRPIQRRSENEFIVPGTIEYNERTLESYVSLDRSAACIQPLLSIGWIAQDIANLRVLSVGPRTEMELFALLAAGFKLENIELLDLFSYSPYFTLGDMHELPYKNGMFDVIILSFVLGYSTRPEVAVGEVRRVAKDRAVVSIGHSRQQKSTGPVESGSGGGSVELSLAYSVETTADVLDFFGPSVGSIYFRSEPEVPYSQFTDRAIAIFELLKRQ